MRHALLPFARFLLAAIVILTACRLGLSIYFWDRVQATDGLGFILLQGMRFDLVVVGLLAALPGILLPWFLLSKRTAPLAMGGLRLWFTIALVWMLFMEMATPSFIEEYDTRPNYLFVEYLSHPKEVFSTLWGAYRFQIIAAAMVLPLAAVGIYKRLLPRTEGPKRLNFFSAVSMFVLCTVACFGMIRSTLDHRAVNPSTVAFSADAMVNTLPLSSGYTLLYALYESRLEEEGGIHYGKMDEAEVFERVKRSSGLAAESFTNPDIPTLHLHKPTRDPARPLNFVIVLEESLGAEYVGCMGGPPITPELDALKGEGIWFENLYATGTRSVRGIEAVLTSFLPTSARSVVKLPRSQRNFFTVAELLKRQGYQTSFLYGGESHFDNMSRFFTGNGFEEIVDELDFVDPVFTGSWGASDEDLFHLAHEKFEKMGDQPFFSLIFTSSNHSPFEFPDGRIELHDPEKATVHNAVKYADWALGDFFRLAKDSSYWDNTVFLVVADHNSRVRGATLMPISRFHIPAMFLGGSIKPDNVETIASQIDLLPTALSLIGVEALLPSLGRDLTVSEQRYSPGRAIMQYHSTNAYMSGDQVIVFQRGKDAEQYVWKKNKLRPVEELDAELRLIALAHTLWPQLAYSKGTYRLPAVSD